MSRPSPLRLVPDRRPAAGERGALFPVTRFPAGAAAPVGFLVVSLLVAAVALAVLVRSPAQQSIAASTVAAQRASADQLKDLVLAGVTTSAQALDGEADRLASVLETDTASGMATLRTAVPELGAIAVIDARTGTVLGREGDVPTDRARRPELGRPEVRVAGVVPIAQAVMTVPAGPWLRVVVSTDLRLPPPPPVVGRHLLLMSGRGEVLGRVGDASTGVRTDESSVLARVAAAQNAGDGAVAAGGDVSDDAALAAGGRDPSRTVAHASWSALGLPLMSGSPPVAAAVMSRATPEVQEGGSPALWHAAGLAMLAGVAGAVLHGALVAPLRRVRADGERAVLHPRVPVRRSRVREVDAVAAAFGRRVRRPRRSHGVRAAIVVPAVGSVLLAALAIGVTTFDRETGAPTADHVEAVRRDAVATADELRRRVDDGAARVHSSVVPLPGDPASGDLVARADALAAVDGPFRSVSIVDRRGAVLYRAGRLPLRAGEPVPATDGVAQLNTTGRVPLLVATGWTPERSHAVLAEYDVAALLELLRSRDAHMRVVDAGERGVLDGQAAVAFRPLPEGPLRDAVHAVRSGVPTAVPATVDGVPTAVVAEPLGDRDATATLGWTLVARQPLADLDFRHDTATRAVLAVAGLAAVAVVGATAWCWLVVLTPLRRLGRSVTAGHRTHVVERADEVGALAAALNRRTR